MRFCLSVLIPSLLLASLVGCRGTQVQSVHNGASTWRADDLPVDRAGGVINVEVTSERIGAITVLLIEENTYRSGHGKEVQPSSAARGQPRAGRVTVRFSGLPPGEYRVCAFQDEDGDGMLIESWHPFPDDGAARFTEPSSEYKLIQLKRGETLPVALDVR